MMMMRGQVFGEFKVAVLIAGDQSVYDPSVNQFCQVAVGAALGQRRIMLKNFGNREWAV